jgi:hypothetical protein
VIINKISNPLLRNFLFILFFLFSLSDLTAQPLTVIKGKVTDATTNEPIPFANVVFKGAPIGTSTDFNGMYTISTKNAKDSLSVIFMGYKPKSRYVLIGKTQTIDFQLIPVSVTLKEVVINSGENPAWKILRKVWKNKDSVSKDNQEAYQCQSYTRIELAADNIDHFKNSTIMKSFANLFDSLQVAAGDEGKMVLPVFISETMSDLYYLKDPYRKTEHIKATKITGVGIDDGSTTAQYMGNSFQDYNFDKDWLSILEKDFISPIAKSGLLFYKYYLIDSMVLDGKFCYEIKVIPKRAQDLAFTGTIWITDTTYALKRIAVEIGKSANLNFIERIKIQQDLMPVNEKVWAPSRTRIMVDVSEPTKNTFGLIGKSYTVNNNWVINKPKNIRFYDDKLEKADDYQEKSKKYWDTARPEVLDPITLHIYDIVDSVKEIPKIKNYTKLGKILGIGYVEIGKDFQVGPWAMIYGYNDVEGNRFRLGLRTTYSFSKNWILKSYVAYGTKDDKLKYNFMIERFLSRSSWARTGLQYKVDVEGMGAIDPFYERNAVYSTSQQLGLYSRMNENRVYRYWISSDVFNKKFNEQMIVTYSYFKPLGNYVFAYYDRFGKIRSDFNNFEVAFQSRYAPRETFIVNDNDRFSLGSSKAPVFTAKAIFGIKNVINSEFEYQKISFNISQILRWGAWGRTNYSITATKIWGTVPYPLLNILPGNENYIASTSTYNLMNFFEFVNDESIEVIVNHYFGGLFFNRVPLLKKLELREVIGAKAVFGSFNKNNYNAIPDTNQFGEKLSLFTPLQSNKPYVEASFGVENILKVLRIDFIYRLTYRSEPDVQLWGIKGTLSFQF